MKKTTDSKTLLGIGLMCIIAYGIFGPVGIMLVGLYLVLQ